MNWSRTKTWLIVLFVGINLFLLFTLAKENIAQSTISEQMVTDTVAVLARNGITVDAQLIPRKMPALSAVEVLNTVTDQKALAESILGGPAAYDAQTNQYLRSTAILRFDGDNIAYININPAQSNVYTDTQGAIDYAKAFFTDAGFDISKAQMQVKKQTGNETELVFTQRLDSYPLLDSRLEITVTKRGVSKMEGCWFYMSDDQSGNSGASGRVKEITSVLIDFISDPYRAGSSTEITSITLGYTTGNKNSYHKSVSAMPSWYITTSDGREYYYDAN